MRHNWREARAPQQRAGMPQGRPCMLPLRPDAAKKNKEKKNNLEIKLCIAKFIFYFRIVEL